MAGGKTPSTRGAAAPTERLAAHGGPRHGDLCDADRKQEAG